MRDLIFFMLISFSVIGQTEQKTTIVGSDITTTYNPITKELVSCITTGTDGVCKTSILIITSHMMLGAELNKNLKAFFTNPDVKYDVFGQRLQKMAIGTHAFVPTVIVDVKELDAKETAVITIDKAFKSQYFKIGKKEDKFVVELNETTIKAITVEEFIPTKKPLEDSTVFRQELTTFVTAMINNKKVDLQAEIQKGEDDFVTKSTQAIYDAVVTPKEIYVFEIKESFENAAGVTKELSVYSAFEKNTFTLKITDASDITTTPSYGPYSLTISEANFTTKVISQHSDIANTSNNKTALKNVYTALNSKFNTTKQENAVQEIKDEVTRRVELLQKADKTYSGQIKLEGAIDLESKGVGDKKYTDSKVKFEPEYALVRFFNDRFDNVAIVGKLNNDPDTEYTLYNKNYSLPIREFLNRNATNKFTAKDGTSYRYNYQDVLKFLPNTKFNYAVKNQEIRIVPDTPKDVEDRSVLDYFTGIFFTDVVGLNSNNENSFIVAEAQIKIPFHLRNYRTLTLADHFSAYARFNLFNGFEGGNRRVDLADVITDDVATFNESTQTFTTDNFNLFTNTNLDVGLQIVPLTIEWKGAASFIYFRYGLRFLRTGVQYNLSQNTTTTNNNGGMTTNASFVEQRNFQVYSTGHEAEINVAIRRQGSLFGADITGGLNWLSETGTNRDDVNLVTTNNTPNFKMELNLYAFTDANKSSSGIFTRLGMNYNLGNSRGYPQLLVGYATNLNTFVNRLGSNEKSK